MDMEKDNESCKLGSLEKRLTLRKNYKESNESNKDNTASTSQSLCDDDSILDFKSPKRIQSVQSKVINKPPDNSKKKVLLSKVKIMTNERKFKDKKLLQNKNIQQKVRQPLIESSFFKSEKKEVESPQNLNNVKTAYVCPLCLKNCKDESLQTAHMKSCAMKNNVSTKKLMDAVELQERQAAERISLGLLSAPLLQDKKKSTSRKMGPYDDPDFQLAIALSKSLYENEEIKEWDEAQIVAISSNPLASNDNTECLKKSTLQSFGFSSNKNTLPINNWPTNKAKRRKPIEPTILQRRTPAERERILTERIAEILMGYQDFTQKSHEKMEESNNVKEKIVLESQLLQQLHKIENTLWNRTKLMSIQDMFYVKQLSPHITPLEEKEKKINKEQNFMQFIEVNERHVKSEKSLDNQHTREINNVVKETNNDEESTISLNSVNMCCKEKKFLDDLATSWRNILNDSSASDIIVFVKNNKHIWTHKLVYYVRCTNILLDVISNDTEFSSAKEKILWVDTDYDVALAFLEFVYCGIIDKYSTILESEVSLSGIRTLGRKYQVHDLFAYLRQKESKSEVTDVKCDNNCAKNTKDIHLNIETSLSNSKLKKSFNTSLNRTHDGDNNKCFKKMSLPDDVDNDLHSSENDSISEKNFWTSQNEKTALMKSDEIHSRSSTPVKREVSTSPDMFDDTSMTKHIDKSAVQSKNLEESSNIHILLSLIKEDTNIDIYSQKILKSQNVEYSKLRENMLNCSKNVGQNLENIDSDPESNLDFSIDNMHKDSITNTPQRSKLKYIQDCSPKIIKHKSDLTLFIEKVQKENAKIDAILDSNIEGLSQVPFTKHNNPFHVDKHDIRSDNIIEKLKEKKPGRLTMIEQHIQSFATKNPEFYSRLSNEHKEDVTYTTTNSHTNTLSSNIMESSQNNISNRTLNFTLLDEKHVKTSEQDTTVLVKCQQSETINQALEEISFDLETNEKDMSMYSKYMKNHKDNSIAKYRSAISGNKLNCNLSDKNMSYESIDENSDFNEAKKDEILTQCVLTQKNTDAIVLLDSDVESISSNISHIVSENNDSNHENNAFNFSQQSINEMKDIEQDVENRNSNGSELLEIGKFSQVTDTKKGKDINSTIQSNKNKLNTTEPTFVTQKSELNNDCEKEESISSPIFVSSSPDVSSDESCNSVLNKESLLQNKSCTKGTSEINNSKLRRSDKFSFNFEDDIYLANVDIDKYEKSHILEKSHSFNTLSMEKMKKTSKCNNKVNVAEDNCKNLDNNAVSLTQNFASIKKFKKKSLSEGQINTNRLYNQKATSSLATQLQCNYIQNIANAKIPKITDKDVTPPPDYNGLSTPELHKEMKNYGLKVQKRSRAVKLLTHIYNELHPLVPEKTIGQQITEISSDESEGPPLKKRNVDNSSEKSSGAEDSDNELSCSQNRYI
ncbi:hypothetical protein PUN28_009097 [Cardiocondyla obscurior]|uniref:BTB domain-containing protein n=2 Tax=Cardiocondyla obscurior TaxID=286306 RepID=A0AAW2FQG0_9HYME